MKKQLLILLLSIITLSAFGQAGSLSQSVYRSRVNDSTAAISANVAPIAAGYAPFYWNNQATTPGWRFWDGSQYVVFNPSSSGTGGWAVTGTTNLTGDVTVSAGSNGLGFTMSPPDESKYFGIEILRASDANTNFIYFADRVLDIKVYGASISESVIQAGDGVDGVNGVSIAANEVQLRSNVSSQSVVRLTDDAVITGTDDVNITAGSATSNHDIVLTAGSGTIHLDSDFLTVNGDHGSSGEVLTSNGSGAAPTWVAPSGGVTDGDKGDITVSSSGTVWDIDAGVVTGTEIGSSVALSGNPTTTTQSFGNNTTRIATTAFVQEAHGTWTDWSASVAPTGFSATTLVLSYYIDNGKTVTVWYQVTGTSNATTFTVTLPIAPNSLYSTAGIIDPVYVFNNGTAAVGRAILTGSSTTVTLESTIVGAAWTASGAKGTKFTVTYQK